ncbi:MAG: hypothetical protein ABW321_34795 [Polyangiales bacterium]
MRARTIALCLQLMAACGERGSEPVVPWAGPEGGVVDDLHDAEPDGLCDATERELGTDAAQADTDHDGWPDGVEVIAGMDPRDPTEPSVDRVVYLQPAAGELTFDLALMVEGHGEAASGELVSGQSLDARSRRAGDYFRGSVAVGALPPENVRDIKPEASRFGMILGRTRLSYRLRFAATSDEPLDCAASLPFEFVVKDEQDRYLAREHYTLIVTADRSALTAALFCRPAACI